MIKSDKTVIGTLESTEELLKDRKGQACFVQYNGEALGKQYFKNIRVGCLIEQGSTTLNAQIMFFD